MKNNAETSTNYIMLFFVAIINIFMALSLNSFSSSDAFLPALFLYFISNLATFLEKINTYEHIASKIERHICYLGFIVSLFVVCCYLANVLHFIDINFQKRHDATYRILIQGRPDTFLTFTSIDVTSIMFIFIGCIPFLSILLSIIPFLRNQGFTLNILKSILKGNLKACYINIIISVLGGIIGAIICHIKYYYSDTHLGNPQYIKYIISFFTVSILISFSILIFRKRPSKTFPSA